MKIKLGSVLVPEDATLRVAEETYQVPAADG